MTWPEACFNNVTFQAQWMFKCCV